jgi:lipopolysaccharide transport system permease protein
MPIAQYFRLVDNMARMALRADAARFFLGYVWWVLEPLLWVSVFYVVFVEILALQQSDFLVFLMTGQLVFLWFSKSVQHASSSIVGATSLVGKINVPKTLFPLATVQEGLYRQVAVFAVLIAFLLLNGCSVTATWWYLAPVILVTYVMILSCSFLGACLVCVARDFNNLIALGMMFLMFTSGIFWDVRGLSDPAKSELIMTINPVAFIVDCYRQIMISDIPPDMVHVFTIGAVFGAILWVMVLLMRRGSQYLALKVITA